MSLLLLAPAGLAALGALLLPLLLHLRRRDERRPVSFAALRWLREQPRPRLRLRMQEWPLLLLRLLLLALLALWLAAPATTAQPALRHWSVVLPGIDPASLPPVREDEQRRWLAPGFPPLEQTPGEAGMHASASSLLRQFDAELPAGDVLSVFVPERFAAADAGLLRLSRAVQWRIVPTAAAAEDEAAAGHDIALHLAVRAAADQPGSGYLRAVAAAWREEDTQQSAIDADPAPAWPADAQVRAWLAQGPLPADLLAWVEQGGTALLASQVELPASEARRPLPWRDAEGLPLLEAQPAGRGQLLRFTRPLTAEAMPQLLQPEFPQRLRQALPATEAMPAPVDPAIVDAAAYRPSTGTAAFVPAPRDLRPWWALAIAVLFLFERWLASAPRRGAVA